MGLVRHRNLAEVYAHGAEPVGRGGAGPGGEPTEAYFTVIELLEGGTLAAAIPWLGTTAPAGAHPAARKRRRRTQKEVRERGYLAFNPAAPIHSNR